MISMSIHHTLSCDLCGRSYGEVGNIEDIPGALRGTGWGIIGSKHFCDNCLSRALELEKDMNPEAVITNPETTKEWGALTENGWIKVSERMPEVGLRWVFGRTKESGMVGVCRYSRELGVWVDERNVPISEEIEYWHYLPVFP